MQIIQRQPGEARGAPRDQCLHDRLPEARLVHRAGRCGAEFRQYARQLRSHLIIERHERERHGVGSRPQHRPQHAREQRIGHALVARTRADAWNAARLRKVAEQAVSCPCRHRRSAPPRSFAPRRLPGHATGASRPTSSGGRAIAAGTGRDTVPGNSPERSISCASSRVSMLGSASEFAPQDLPAAGMGGQRRGTIAAPVMQPHQQPVRLLGERIFGDQPLGVDQRAGDMSARFLVRQRRPRSHRGAGPGSARARCVPSHRTLRSPRSRTRRAVRRRPPTDHSPAAPAARRGRDRCRRPARAPSLRRRHRTPRCAAGGTVAGAGCCGLSAAPHRATASRRRGRAAWARPRPAEPAARHPCVRARPARRCPAPGPARPAGAGGSPPMPRSRARPAPRGAASYCSSEGCSRWANPQIAHARLRR